MAPVQDHSSIGDGELLRMAAHGDAEAFGEFYERHEALVLHYFLRRVRNREVALDLAAEVFAAALEREAVQARIIDENDYADVADRLRCSRLVARKRVSRGLARLRARMLEVQ